jgi:anti-sigma regulatory factor (Ser/Thr protein kinase)
VPSPAVISLAGEYRGQAVDDLLEALRPAAGLQRGTPWRLDLSELTFVTPTALAVAGATFEALCPVVPVPGIVLPTDDRCRTYVQRMDVLPVPWRTQPEEFDRRPPRTFCPMHRFMDDADYPQARREVMAAVVRMCDVDAETSDALALCLDELCENVVHHARPATPAVAVAQAWPSRGTLQVAIADHGRGVRASLAENPKYAGISDDVVAAREAFRLGVTSTPDRNAGMGLALAHHVVRPNGGKVGVRTGSAAVTRGAVESEQHRGQRLEGTLVVLEVRIDTPLDIAQAYADMDKGTDAR